MSLSLPEAKKILIRSQIFSKCWDNSKKFPPEPSPKRGEPKGPAFFGMYSDIIAELPQVNSILNIGLGDKGETVKWLKIYNGLFGLSRFENLELVQSRINKMKNVKGKDRDYINTCHLGDVRNIDELNLGTFDIVLWSHGPEHIHRDDWKDTFAKLDKVGKIIVIHLPWGTGYDNAPGKKHPLGDAHLSGSVMRGEMEEFGFKVRYVGVRDTRQSNMYGWKRGLVC